MFARPPFSAVRIIVVLIAAGCSAGLFAAAAAESAAPPARVQTPSWDFFEFVDLLPDNVSGLLPNIKPIGALRLYLRPRYGDLIRREQERGSEIEAVRRALVEGERSGQPQAFDCAAFTRRTRAQPGG